jgi:hypothetical protein
MVSVLPHHAYEQLSNLLPLSVLILSFAGLHFQLQQLLWHGRGFQNKIISEQRINRTIDYLQERYHSLLITFGMAFSSCPFHRSWFLETSSWQRCIPGDKIEGSIFSGFSFPLHKRIYNDELFIQKQTRIF